MALTNVTEKSKKSTGSKWPKTKSPIQKRLLGAAQSSAVAHAFTLMVKSRVLEERLIKIYKAGEAYFWIGAPGEEAFGVPLGMLVHKGQGPAARLPAHALPGDADYGGHGNAND